MRHKKRAGTPPGKKDLVKVKTVVEKRGLSDAKFKEWFVLLWEVSHHDFGALCNTLWMMESIPIDAEATKRLEKCLSRTDVMFHSLTQRESARTDLEEFSEEELQELGLEILESRRGYITTTISNIQELRRMMLEEITKLKTLLENIDQIYDEMNVKPNIRVASLKKIEVILLICDYLEQLTKGDFDFFAKSLEPITIRDLTINEQTMDEIIKSKLLVTHISYESEEIKKRKVHAQEVFLVAILHNLRMNAERSCKEKSVDCKVIVTVRQVGNKIVFEFTDNGNGMSAEIMEKLNKGIHATTKTQDPEQHGKGFGICRDLARKMGADVYVKESELGKGTTIALEMKIVE